MKSPNSPRMPSQPRSDLDSKYRAIGISAVAAALHYQSDARNPAYAPAPATPDDRFHEAAASSHHPQDSGVRR
jgi:hypothetical protein